MFLKNLIKKLMLNSYVLVETENLISYLIYLDTSEILKNVFLKNNIFDCKNIELFPLTFNLKRFYSRIDVMLFPGYMNAVGRPVIEASLCKKPSIIALNKYNNDTAKKDNCLIFKPGDLFSLEKKNFIFI